MKENCVENESHIYESEINKLHNMLVQASIPFEQRKVYNGYQIIYPDHEHCKGDVICHEYSYGHKKGLLEAMGFDINRKKDGDDVIGCLTVEEAFEYFKKQYELDSEYEKIER